MKKLFYFFGLSFFIFSANSLAAEEKDKIGFKGVYLGQDSKKACLYIKNKYPSEKFYEFKVGDEDPSSMLNYQRSFNGCEVNGLSIKKGKNGLVERITADYEVFGIEKMSIEEFAQLVVDNFDFVNNLEGKQGLLGDVEYTYTDTQKIGFSIRVASSFVQVQNEKVIVNKPSFD